MERRAFKQNGNVYPIDESPNSVCFFCKRIVFSTEVSAFAPNNLLKQHHPVVEYYENLYPICKLTNDKL